MLSSTGTYLPKFNGALWVGYRKRNGKNSAFMWSDNTCSDYVNWGCGEPNNAGSGEDCTAVSLGGYNSGRWNDAGCSSQNTYVCEKAAKSGK